MHGAAVFQFGIFPGCPTFVFCQHGRYGDGVADVDGEEQRSRLHTIPLELRRTEDGHAAQAAILCQFQSHTSTRQSHDNHVNV